MLTSRSTRAPSAGHQALLLLIPAGLLLVSGCPTRAQGIAPSQSRLGINLAGPADWNTELPFVDVFQLARTWISQRQGQPWGRGPELELDANGWVKRLEPDCWAETPLCTIDGGHYPAGEYVCLYEGEGRVEFWNIQQVVSNEPGRIVFEPDPARGGFFLRINETNPANYIRNIRVLMPGFEGTYTQDPWNPTFLSRWKEFNAFRFMDWMETNGSTVSEWSDRPTPERYTCTARGVPLEHMIDLCNRLGLNPWFCMPHLATDDYVRRFAEQVKRDLKPDLKVYIEYSNEIWNSMFAQTRYANDKGVELGFHDKPWEAGWRYSAYRSVQMFAIWEQVFGRERLVRVIASQAANPYVSRAKLAFQDAYKQCDALAIAPYVTLNISPTSDPNADTVAAWTVDQVLDYLEQQSLPRSVEWITASKAVADEYGLRLITYEAGQHAVGVGGGENNEALTRRLHEANRHPRMGLIYTRYLDAWRDVGGGDLCCLFSSVGSWSKWGSWGLLEHNDDDTPKYRAVVEWNLANPLLPGDRG